MTTTIRRDQNDAAADMRFDVRAVTWHRPLLVLALAMAGLTLVSLAGLAFDGRELTGQPIWAKPLKFSVSILIYAVTFSWLIGLTRGILRRGAWWAGTIAAVALVLEMVVIVGAVVAGTTSHFNVATPISTVGWVVMAASIVVVWVATLIIAFALFFAKLGDPARSLAIRAGAIIALAGMGLAFLMTGPTPEQLADFRGIAGAHAVGVPDGGAGIPILGWSTEGGDLRIPHFVGMHALQALPLVVILLEVGARRIPVLRQMRVRFALACLAVGLAIATVTIVTLQALAGESIVAPSAPFAAAIGAVVLAASLAIATILWIGSRAASRADVTLAN